MTETQAEYTTGRGGRVESRWQHLSSKSAALMDELDAECEAAWGPAPEASGAKVESAPELPDLPFIGCIVKEPNVR